MCLKKTGGCQHSYYTEATLSSLFFLPHTHISKHSDWQQKNGFTQLHGFSLTSLFRNGFNVMQQRQHCLFIGRVHSCTLCTHFSHKIKNELPFSPCLVTFNFTVEPSLYYCTGPRPGNCMLPGYQTDVSIYVAAHIMNS